MLQSLKNIVCSVPGDHFSDNVLFMAHNPGYKLKLMVCGNFGIACEK